MPSRQEEVKVKFISDGAAHYIEMQKMQSQFHASFEMLFRTFCVRWDRWRAKIWSTKKSSKQEESYEPFPINGYGLIVV